MKKILLSSLAVLAMTMTSCENFLDSEDYTGKNSSTFPKTETDVNQMVASVYKSTFYESFHANDVSQYWTWANLAADDQLGGGGQNDVATQALDLLGVNAVTQMEQLWKAGYEAINRANAALAVVDNISDEDLRNQTRGELLTMRAYNYFDLVKCFENIPLISKAPENVQEAQTAPAQSTPEEVYTKIATDLYLATKCMPQYKYDGWNKLAYGKVSVWATKALLGRVFLFYTGFYGKSTLPVDAEECGVSEITKDMVTAEIKDIIDNSGHGLLNDYRSLWAYSNEYTARDYDYVSDLSEKYAEGNKEILMAINYMYLGEWSGTQLHISNQFALFFGIRFNDTDDDKFTVAGGAGGSVYPFSNGWGCGPVAPNLVKDWKAAEPGDKRFDASILTLPSNFNYAGDDTDNWMQATGYHQKKVCAVRSSGGDFYSWCAEAEGGKTQGHYQASHYQSLPLIRYAEVLLMYDELTETNSGMTQLRTRAGLPEKPYTLENLQNERRWELAFEGVRWDDLRRWGIAPQALAKQEGVDIYNVGVKTVNNAQIGGYVARYNATRGFYKIPQTQVDLSNGAYKQNAGWDGTEGFYGTWAN